MRVLVDTNLLTRLVSPTPEAMHSAAENCHKALLTAEVEPCIAPQCLYEFWVVATRPRQSNGFGATTEEVKQQIDQIQSQFSLLPDDSAIFPTWLELVTRYGVQGKPAHDARLVAAMLTHGVTHLVTFNAADFTRFKEIKVFTPEAVATGQSLDD